MEKLSHWKHTSERLSLILDSSSLSFLCSVVYCRVNILVMLCATEAADDRLKSLKPLGKKCCLPFKLSLKCPTGRACVLASGMEAEAAPTLSLFLLPSNALLSSTPSVMLDRNSKHKLTFPP